MSSKLGWIVAAGLLIVIALAIVFAMQPKPLGPADERVRDPQFLAKRDVRTNIDAVVGAAPTGEGNAGDDYYRAVTMLRQHADKVDALLGRHRPGRSAVGRSERKLLQDIHRHVAAGAAKADMQYTLTHEPKKILVRFRYADDPADDMKALARAMILLADGEIQYGPKYYGDAERALRSAFRIGWHMVRERGRPYMVIVGLEIQQEALFGVQDDEGRTLLRGLTDLHELRKPPTSDLSDAVQRYGEELDALLAYYLNKSGHYMRRLKPKAANLFHIVEHDQDRAWRVQALLLLGMVKFQSTDANEVKYAIKLIERFLGGDDPLLAAAARAAKELTKEQYRFLGTEYSR